MHLQAAGIPLDNKQAHIAAPSPRRGGEGQGEGEVQVSVCDQQEV
jgi:hypothetical protein